MTILQTLCWSRPGIRFVRSAVGAAAANLSALGEGALALAKNPYVLGSAADAALLYAVIKEGAAAYRGQCHP